MNQLALQACTFKEFPKIRPLLDTYSDIFDFTQKRLIVSQAGKCLDENYQGPTSFVAMHDGVMIGFWGGLRDRNNPFQINMFCLVVKRGYQGQGVGTQLFEAACQALAEQGFSQVLAHLKGTYPPRAKRFYTKLGFKPWFDEDYTGASDQDTAMIYRLKPATKKQEMSVSEVLEAVGPIMTGSVEG